MIFSFVLPYGTRGPYYSFAAVLARLAPSETPFRPQNLDPRLTPKARCSSMQPAQTRATARPARHASAPRRHQKRRQRRTRKQTGAAAYTRCHVRRVQQPSRKRYLAQACKSTHTVTVDLAAMHLAHQMDATSRLALLRAMGTRARLHDGITASGTRGNAHHVISACVRCGPQMSGPVPPKDGTPLQKVPGWDGKYSRGPVFCSITQ